MRTATSNRVRVSPSPRRSIPAASAAAPAAALALAGCGLGAGSTPSGVVAARDARLRRADDRSPRPDAKVVGADTVMRMLERNARVGDALRAAASSSRSTASRAAAAATGSTTSTASQAPKGAAETKLHAGDHVWWDRHDWRAAESIPAVVGSFPEPFVDGYGGKRWPLRIECTQHAAAPVQRDPERVRRLRPRRLRGLPAVLAVQPVAARRRRPLPTRSAPTPPRRCSPRPVGGERRLRALRGRRPAPRAARRRRRASCRRAGAGAGLIAATRWHGPAAGLVRDRHRRRRRRRGGAAPSTPRRSTTTSRSPSSRIAAIPLPAAP